MVHLESRQYHRVLFQIAMSVPQPPHDHELKNIIDKLANFVARNGVEFERMTKQKQRDNPKFQFLFGGDFFDYYSYRVAAEQTMHQQQACDATIAHREIGRENESERIKMNDFNSSMSS